MDQITRAFAATIDDVSPGERSVVARINTDAVDRYRTVIDPMGIDLANYRKNPVVMWEHAKKERSTPIGRNLWIKPRRQQRDLIAKTVFLDDEFSGRLFELYRDEVLRGFSVNCLETVKGSPPTSAEIRSRPELAGCKLVYRTTELAEYSAVAIPGNAEALTLAVSRGLWVPEELRSASPRSQKAVSDQPSARPENESPVPELPPASGARTFGQVHAAMVDLIRAQLPRDALKASVREALDLMRGRV